MNFKDYIHIFEELETTNSSNEKIQILQESLIEEGFFFTLLTGEYEPLQFSQKMLDKCQINPTGTKTLSINGIKKFLNKLRNLSGNLKISFIEMFATKIDQLQWKWLQRIILKKMNLNISTGVVLKFFSQRFQFEDTKKLYYICNDIEKVFDELHSGNTNLDVVVGEPISPMLSKKFDGENNEPYIVQPKYDGIYSQIHKTDGEIKVFTRQLKDISDNVPEIVQQIEDQNIAWDFIVEGEIIPKIPGQTFQSVMNRVTRKHARKAAIKKTPLKLVLFNVIYWDKQDLFDVDYQTRLNMLNAFDMVAPSKLDYANNLEEFFNEQIQKGHEGLMLKKPDGKYYPGIRNDEVVKWKLDFKSIDCAITNTFMGTGKYKDTIGAIEIGVRKNGEIVPLQRVGSGLTDYNRNQLLTTSIEERVVEIHYGDITDDGKLRFPVFVCFRDDLTLKDVDEL